MTHLQDGKDIRLGDWKTLEIEILNTFQFLTAKPVVYLVRVHFILYGPSRAVPSHKCEVSMLQYLCSHQKTMVPLG